MKRKPTTKAARLPKGVRHYFRAECAKCAWYGPEREDAARAKHDHEEHAKDAERYVMSCSKAWARIEAEDRRKAEWNREYWNTNKAMPKISG
jgi:hypothetical protein